MLWGYVSDHHMQYYPGEWAQIVATTRLSFGMIGGNGIADTRTGLAVLFLNLFNFRFCLGTKVLTSLTKELIHEWIESNRPQHGSKV